MAKARAIFCGSELLVRCAHYHADRRRTFPTAAIAPNRERLQASYCSLFQGRWWARWERRTSRNPNRTEHRAGHDVCGPTPSGSLLGMDTLRPLGPHDDDGQLGIALLANESLDELRGARVSTGFRLSTTANLVRLRWPRRAPGANP